VKDLPFASKPKQLKKQKKPSLENRRAVILNSEERKVATLIQNINTIRNEKQRKAKLVQEKKRAEYLKKKSKVEEMDHIMQKKRAKETFKQEGIKRKRMEGAASRKKAKPDDS
jgi:ribosome biogenesis protein BMS1